MIIFGRTYFEQDDKFQVITISSLLTIFTQSIIAIIILSSAKTLHSKRDFTIIFIVMFTEVPN